jgi:hypothetical protein
MGNQSFVIEGEALNKIVDESKLANRTLPSAKRNRISVFDLACCFIPSLLYLSRHSHLRLSDPRFSLFSLPSAISSSPARRGRAKPQLNALQAKMMRLISSYTNPGALVHI